MKKKRPAERLARSIFDYPETEAKAESIVGVALTLRDDVRVDCPDITNRELANYFADFIELVLDKVDRTREADEAEMWRR